VQERIDASNGFPSHDGALAKPEEAASALSAFPTGIPDDQTSISLHAQRPAEAGTPDGLDTLTGVSNWSKCSYMGVLAATKRISILLLG
jgi:hypothetical protein